MLVGRASPCRVLCVHWGVLLIVSIAGACGLQCGGPDPTCHGVACVSAPFKNFTCPQGTFCGQADVSFALLTSKPALDRVVPLRTHMPIAVCSCAQPENNKYLSCLPGAAPSPPPLSAVKFLYLDDQCGGEWGHLGAPVDCRFRLCLAMLP